MSRAAVVAITIVVLLVVGGATIVARGAPPSWDTANGVVDGWLGSMQEPSGDRGWSLLSAQTQSLIYDNDARQYWSDLDGVDWSEVAWAPANGHVDDGAYYSGYIWLRSHPSTLPRFLIQRGIATPDCIEGSPAGIRVHMSLGWFNPPRIGALIGKAGDADPCAIAFAEEPGPRHEPWDFVGGAWASPGSIQRVGVLDSSGLVTAVGWGRENPPLDEAVSVTSFEPGDLAVTWRGASCDSNTTLVVEGTPSAFKITVRRGLADGCSGTDVIYDSILELRSAVQPENVEVDLVGPAGTAAAPAGIQIPIGGERGPLDVHLTHPRQ